MLIIKNSLCHLALAFYILISNQANSMDIVKLHMQELSENKAEHTIEVIRHALEVSESEFGPFELHTLKLMMNGSRMRKSLLEGELINVLFLPANDAWDKEMLTIKVPVRLGLLSYRLLMANKKDVHKFSQINDIETLNYFSAGLTAYWQTTKVYKINELKMVETGHFEGIFSMLDKGRFDYIPRGLYEIYDELESRQDALKNIVVEPTLVLNIPMYTYVYVSPKSPELAKRLNFGLQKMLDNGKLKEILFKYFGDDIERANIKNRKMIEIDNPYYKNNEGETYKNLLF